MMGYPNMEAFLNKDEVQWVAVCDLDDIPLQKAKGIVDDYYGNGDCAMYHDFRELCLRKDLDAISIAVPDHWHALVAITCVPCGSRCVRRETSDTQPGGRPGAERRGGPVMDVYGRRAAGRGSVANFHHASELVRNGRIGKVLAIRGRPGPRGTMTSPVPEGRRLLARRPPIWTMTSGWDLPPMLPTARPACT